jgi:hypothetical protein
MALTFSTTASAGTFDPGNSFLDLKIGNIPTIRLDAGTSSIVAMADDGFGGHGIAMAGSLFQTTSFAVQSAAFTGFPQLTGLKIDLHQGSGLLADGFTAPNSVGPGSIGGFGGYVNATGTAILEAGGFFFTVDLSILGNGGTTSVLNVLNNTIVVEAEPYGTAPVQMTGLSSNILYVPSLGVTGVAFTLNLTTVQVVSAIEQTTAGQVDENYTVTVNGYNNLMSASQAGTVKMVSPFRMGTGNLAGNVAGASWLTLVFVPEPGTVLLLVSGAVGLALIGRKRMNK